jgi:hypothetical protein
MIQFLSIYLDTFQFKKIVCMETWIAKEKN